jgi:hypothetical protein
VTALDVKAQVDELRNTFAGDNLPMLVRREDIDFDVEQTYANRPFRGATALVALTPRLLQKAMIDYYRAYTQSALWVEDNLVALNELQAFEADLVDQWERQFEFMTMKLPDRLHSAPYVSHPIRVRPAPLPDVVRSGSSRQSRSSFPFGVPCAPGACERQLDGRA